MDITTAITEIRNKTNDRDKVGLDDSELLSYLNEAIQYIANYLISIKSPIVVADFTANTPTTTLPDNFAKLAGGFPVKRTGNEIQLLVEPPIKIRYLVSYPTVTTSDDMPFEYESLNQSAIKLACIYANSQKQTDVTQDKSLLDEVNAAIERAVSEN